MSSQAFREARTETLAELAEFEAAVFRFGQQVRAFLAAMPAGLPKPSGVLPRYTNGTSPGGGIVHGGGSYVHLHMDSAEGTEAWARHLGVEVTRETYSRGVSKVSFEGPLDGLTIYASFTGADRAGGES